MTDKEKQIFDKYGNYNFPTDIKQSGQNIATTQIEEMAKEIHFNYWGLCAKDNCANCPHNVLNICKDKKIAEKLYNAGYRKIPEGSVVLSRKEYAKDFCSQFNKGYERGSKETAREILKLVDKKLDLYQNGVIGGSLYDDGYKSAVQEIKFSIKKQFGGVVEE